MNACPGVDAINKFWSRVDKSPAHLGCWLWTGYVTQSGYGQLTVNTIQFYAHRFAWLLRHGSLPDSQLELDHICRNRRCVNPEHLRVLTQRENTMLGVCPMAINARKTHCPQGHPLSPNNTFSNGPRRNWRRCLECKKAHEKRYAQSEAGRTKVRARKRAWRAKRRALGLPVT